MSYEACSMWQKVRNSKSESKLVSSKSKEKIFLQPGEVENKYSGLLEKKWTSVIRLQKKVRERDLFEAISCHEFQWEVRSSTET